jgi:aspartyl-tRNA(Asn)/glutamyl-tRNA(Gln) amidotransferase subunit C
VAKKPAEAAPLTADEVRKIAVLSRLHLSDADVEQMTRQLGAILDYVQQLRAVDTEGVEPLAHPLPINNVFRDDEPIPSLPRDEALANAPNRQGDFYGVPAVLD